MIMVGGPGDALGNFSNLTAVSKHWVPQWVKDLPSNATNLYSIGPAYTGGCWMTQPSLNLWGSLLRQPDCRPLRHCLG